MLSEAFTHVYNVLSSPVYGKLNVGVRVKLSNAASGTVSDKVYQNIYTGSYSSSKYITGTLGKVTIRNEFNLYFEDKEYNAKVIIPLYEMYDILYKMKYIFQHWIRRGEQLDLKRSNISKAARTGITGKDIDTGEYILIHGDYGDLVMMRHAIQADESGKTGTECIAISLFKNEGNNKLNHLPERYVSFKDFTSLLYILERTDLSTFVNVSYAMAVSMNATVPVKKPHISPDESNTKMSEIIQAKTGSALEYQRQHRLLSSKTEENTSLLD